MTISDYYKAAWDDGVFRTLIFALMLGVMIGLMLCGCDDPAWAGQVDMSIIRKIESNGNPLAISRTGAIGLYQIMPCVLQEYNARNNTKYTRLDLFSPSINTAVADWYMGVRIPQLLKHYRQPLTVENILRSYNAGVRSVIKGYTPKETKNYIKKYKQLARL